MSWTRKLFVGGGSKNTEITTVWSTSWSTNTSQITEFATGRDTTTFWAGAAQNTQWNTDRTTYGTIVDSYSTQWNTSKTTSTTWTVQSNVVVGSDSRNTTTNFTTYWQSYTGNQPMSRNTNTTTTWTTNTTRQSQSVITTSRNTNSTVTESVPVTHWRNSCADVMQTTHWNTPWNTTCTTTSQNVWVTYYEYGKCIYYLTNDCDPNQEWYRDSLQYHGQNGCNIMYTTPVGGCEQTDANRSRQCFDGEWHCPETQHVINCATQYRNTNTSTLKEQCNQVVDYYTYTNTTYNVTFTTYWTVPGPMVDVPYTATVSRNTNTSTNWDQAQYATVSRNTSRSTNTAWDLYSTVINTYSQNTVTNWNPSRTTTTSYEGNYSTNWNTNSTTGGGGVAGSRNTTTSFNTNWTTEYSNNTTVDTDRTTSWLTS